MLQVDITVSVKAPVTAEGHGGAACRAFCSKVASGKDISLHQVKFPDVPAQNKIKESLWHEKQNVS